MLADLRSQGLSQFQGKKYEESILSLRKYLRKVPKDYGMWNILGVAYYHTGQPRKGLRYLKHVERKTTEKSYNYYYQGLCFIASEQPDQAREYFAYIASRYQDDYASRSTFELGVLEYKLRNAPRTYYWLSRYLQLFPTGPYVATATAMLQSLRESRWLEGVEGVTAPNQEEALFKYNNLSLGSQPHYWFFQAGGLSSGVSNYEPTQNEGLKASSNDLQAGLFDAGIGIGPRKLGDVTSFAGYTYRQRWYTDLDRIGEYMEDPGDLQYFPFRADQLERRHQLYADFRRQLNPNLFLGLFSRLEYKLIGSNLFPSVDNSELAKVTNISQTQLVIPWIGYSFNPNFRNLLYFYWRKELNKNAAEFSNKTYDLGLNGKNPVLSLGLSTEYDLPENQINISFDGFQYEFIFNDPWLDYTRQGGIASVQHEFLPRWFIQGLFGIYQDKYRLPRIKKNRCNDAPSKNSNNSEPPSICTRQDSGLLLSATVYWNYTQFHRFSFQFEQVKNSNAKLKEFESSTQNIKGVFTMAFPSVKRTVRYIDRFADSAFTKEY